MSILKDSIQMSKRIILLNTSLFAAFFTFYFVFSLHLLPKVAGQTIDPIILQIIFSFTIGTTLLTSYFLKQKLLKMRIIYASTIITAVLTLLLNFALHYALIMLIVVFVGIFFSIAQLSYFVHFWHSTSSEARGRIGGLIGFITLPFYFVISTLSASNLGITSTIIIAIGLSAIPIVALLLRPKKTSIRSRKEGIYPEKRTIMLYAIPWIIFSITNVTFSKNITLSTIESVQPSLFEIFVLIQTVSALVGALIGGALADFFGRRIALALSVTLYGMSLALSGLVQIPSLYYFVFFADGLSWGILLTLYSFVIWGDLSNNENCAKMYSLGLMIFYFSGGIGLLPTGIAQIPVIASAFIGCMLIFFSNVPIALARELSSSDFRDRVRLKMHIKAVKKEAKHFEN